MVEAILRLAADEIRIIGHSINWRLNGPYEHTSPSESSAEDMQTLRIMFNELCCQQRACQFGEPSIIIEVGLPYSCTDGRMQLPPTYFRLIMDALALFLGEFRHYPADLELLTALPLASTSELFSRMQATFALSASPNP